MSANIAVITDSSTCLPKETISRLGIEVVPIPITIADETVPDGSITVDELFAKSERQGTVPKTATPSPGDFVTAFRAARERGARSILCLTLASKYSGTYQAARTGADLFHAQSPNTSAGVVDSRAIAAVHGFAVEAAATALCAGGDVDEAVRSATEAVRKSVMVGTIESVRYIARSGRVPRLVGRAADALGVRPVMSFAEGRARLAGQPRTIDAAVACIVDRVEKKLGASTGLEAVVVHAASPSRAETLATRASDKLDLCDLRIAECSAAVAAHTGPGFVALAVTRRD